jgi:homoserine O-acetyltransferase
VITGGWRHGDPGGRRKFFVARQGLPTESGIALPDYQLAYETWGTLNAARDNAILIEHALTGDSHVTGPAGQGHPSPGWWSGLVGDGKTIDTQRFFVVAPNVLGGCQGSTGPMSARPDGWAWGSRFPRITIRDQVRAEVALADSLGIDSWRAVLGGSMGGMRALEWGVGFPGRVRALLVAAASAASSAEQIAWSWTQIQSIVADHWWQGGDYYHTERGPVAGLGAARRIAQLSYRSEEEFATRFGRTFQGGENPYHGGRYAVESYLDHHAAKLADRFDAGSYVRLSESMNGHDVGRGRGGVDAALARVTADTVVVGVSSDRLYPLVQQEEIAAGIRSAGHLHVVDSPYGHDGFLIETDRLAVAVKPLLG